LRAGRLLQFAHGMNSTLPRVIKLRARASNAAGLAVGILFRMRFKNDFSFVVFLDENGNAELTRDRYLKAFDEDRHLFLMDYADPRTGSTGVIETKVLTKEDIIAALEAHDVYRSSSKYEEGYRSNLEAALAQLQIRKSLPDMITIDCEVQ
jgi:hypothetical protein